MGPLGELQGDVQIICDIGRLNLGGIEIAHCQVFDEEASMPSVDFAVLYAPSDQMGFESLQ